MQNKSKENLARDLMYGWCTGWNEYIQNPKDDYPAIISIAEKCAKIAGVSMEEEEGYMRIKSGLARIALFCRESIEWKVKNLFKINQGLQDVLLQMQAYAKAKEAEQAKLKENERIWNEAKAKRIHEEKLQRESSKKALIYCIEEWDYVWEYSYRVYNETKGIRVLKYEAALKEIQSKETEFTEKLKKETEEKRDEYKLKLKEGRY